VDAPDPLESRQILIQTLAPNSSDVIFFRLAFCRRPQCPVKVSIFPNASGESAMLKVSPTTQYNANLRL
jgi:hypothetical protein